MHSQRKRRAKRKDSALQSRSLTQRRRLLAEQSSQTTGHRVRPHRSDLGSASHARPCPGETLFLPIDDNGATDMTSPSRDAKRPSCCRERPSIKWRAQGMPGAGRNPWPACNKESRRQSPQVQPDHPAFPARWVSVLYVISPGTGCLAPVASGSSSPPAWHQHRDARTTRFQRPRKTPHRATTASRRSPARDRSTPFVQRHRRSHRIPPRVS